jgi:hypothetical protein
MLFIQLNRQPIAGEEGKARVVRQLIVIFG